MCGGVFDDLGVMRWRRCLSAFSMLLLSVHHRQFLIDILSLLVTVTVTVTVTLILFLRSTYSNQQFCPDFPLYSADVYRLPLILPIAHMSQWMRAVSTFPSYSRMYLPFAVPEVVEEDPVLARKHPALVPDPAPRTGEEIPKDAVVPTPVLGPASRKIAEWQI